MKAIQIKYMPPKNIRGSRLRAWTEAGYITEAKDYSIDIEEQARQLAQKYADKFNWGQIYGFGSLPNGDWVTTLS